MASFLNNALTRAETFIGAAVPDAKNPLYRLGAVAVFALWVLLATGVYLFIFYRIGAPYDSVKAITEAQWGVGNLVRSVHRYAADLLMVVAVLHLGREFIKGRFRHGRWLAWVSGVACLGALFLSGIVGYWMVWDERAQLIAQLSSRLLDMLPIFGESLTLAFSTPDLITGMFFLIALFVHVTVPLMLFALVWVHVMRISKARVHPPALVGGLVVAFLVAAALIRPVGMLPPADTAKIVAETGTDWFYLFFLPAAAAFPTWAVWGAALLAASLLVAAPWIGAPRREEAASVISGQCTGCEQCALDCPYAAISMTRDGTAEVAAYKCVSCSICVGSCAFDAVEFSPRPAASVEAEARSLVAGGGKVLYLLCAKVVDGGALDKIRSTPGVGLLSLPCAGMVGASLVSAALEAGADGLFIHACSEDDCRYRLGDRLLVERASSTRRPPFPTEAAGRTHIERASLVTADTVDRLDAFIASLNGGNKP